jgi:hypothetical protein
VNGVSGKYCPIAARRRQPPRDWVCLGTVDSVRISRHFFVSFLSHCLSEGTPPHPRCPPSGGLSAAPAPGHDVSLIGEDVPGRPKRCVRCWLCERPRLARAAHARDGDRSRDAGRMLPWDFFSLVARKRSRKFVTTSVAEQAVHSCLLLRVGDHGEQWLRMEEYR